MSPCIASLALEFTFDLQCSRISLATYFLKIFYYLGMYAYLFVDVKNLAVLKVSEDHFGCKNVPAEGPRDIPSSVKVWIKGMSF